MKKVCAKTVFPGPRPAISACLMGLALLCWTSIGARPAAAAEYHVSWLNASNHNAGLPPAHGTIWWDETDGDAYIDLETAHAAAAGSRVDYYINVPEQTNTIEGALEIAIASDDPVWSNVFTTIEVRENTTPGSDGVYSNNVPLVDGHRGPWPGKTGVTIKAIPRHGVTLIGGFFMAPGTYYGMPNYGYKGGMTVDGFHIKEGARGFQTRSPRHLTIYHAPGGIDDYFTLQHCILDETGGGIFTSVGTIGGGEGYSSYSFITNKFAHGLSIFLSYGRDVRFIGNYFSGSAVSVFRIFRAFCEGNTLENGAYFAGANTWAGILNWGNYTNTVINNNFINFDPVLFWGVTLPYQTNVTYVATNNYWSTIHGPYDPTNESPWGHTTTDGTIEVDQFSTDSENFRQHVNMEPEGQFKFSLLHQLHEDPWTMFTGATNVMYVPWATNLLEDINPWPVDMTPNFLFVGNEYTPAGPGASEFEGIGGQGYQYGFNAFSSIQDAVDLIEDKAGTITLAPEKFEINQEITIPNAHRIVGQTNANGGPLTVVTPAAGVESRIFHLQHESARLSHLIISNGVARGSGIAGHGGGVLISAFPFSWGEGGWALNNCLVIDCHAEIGGGVAFTDIGSKYGNYIRNSRLTGNTAVQHGGGIAAMNDMILYNCLIDNNTALEGMGGGLYVAAHDKVTAPAGESVHTYAQRDYLNQGTVFSNNVARGHGGGAYIASRTWNLGYNTRQTEQRYTLHFGQIIPNQRFIGNRSLEGSGGGVYAEALEARNTFELTGVYFFGCEFEGNQAAGQGGGLYLTKGFVDSCTFTGNTASNAGGGLVFGGVPTLPAAYSDTWHGISPYPWVFISYYSASAPDGMHPYNHRVGGLTRNTFTGNLSHNGGGGAAFLTGADYDARTAVMSFSNITDNIVLNGSGGGILDLRGGTPMSFDIWTNGIPFGIPQDGLPHFTGNMADADGGGIYSTNAALNDAVFTGNQASRGGAIHLIGGRAHGCTIATNIATDQGGGAYLAGGAMLERCRISKNTAANSGGGVFLTDGATMRSCLVLGNSATNSGGGVFMQASATNENCTVVMNAAPAGGGISLRDGVVRNGIIWKNGPGRTALEVTGGIVEYTLGYATGLLGEGNLQGDPHFANPYRGDFRVFFISPTIDSGLNRPWMNTATDLLGDPRILNDTVNMGAYEAIGPTPAGTAIFLRGPK